MTFTWNIAVILFYFSCRVSESIFNYELYCLLLIAYCPPRWTIRAGLLRPSRRDHHITKSVIFLCTDFGKDQGNQVWGNPRTPSLTARLVLPSVFIKSDTGRLRCSYPLCLYNAALAHAMVMSAPSLELLT